MKIVDQRLLSELRESRACGFCGGSLRYQPHVHHVHTRGSGRLDVRINLIPLGGPGDCNCHGKAHDGNISRDMLFRAIALREQTTTDQIMEALRRLRYADQEASQGEGEPDPPGGGDKREGQGGGDGVRPDVSGESPEHRQARLEAEETGGWIAF